MDCLHSLCASSVAMQLRVADMPDAVQVIFRVANVPVVAASSGLSSTAANSFSRTEGTAKAAMVLALLFALPELREKYFSVRSSLLVAACSDEVMSGELSRSFVLPCSYFMIRRGVQQSQRSVPPAAANEDGTAADRPFGGHCHGDVKKDSVNKPIFLFHTALHIPNSNNIKPSKRRDPQLGISHCSALSC